MGYLRGISSTGNSVNYLAALNVLAIPYLIYQMKNNKIKHNMISRLLFVILLLVFLLGIFISGSRIAILALVVESLLFFIFILKPRFSFKLLYYIPLVILIVLVFQNIYIDYLSIWVENGLNRVVNIFNGSIILTDRDIINRKSLEILSSSNILIGKGDSFLYNISFFDKIIERTHPHNFILEILMHSGILGMIIFLLYYSFLTRSIYKKLKTRKKSLYMCYLMIFVGLIITLTQPFLTSGLLFNFVMFSNVYSIYSEGKEHEELVFNRNTL